MKNTSRDTNLQHCWDETFEGKNINKSWANKLTKEHTELPREMYE